MMSTQMGRETNHPMLHPSSSKHQKVGQKTTITSIPAEKSKIPAEKLKTDYVAPNPRKVLFLLDNPPVLPSDADIDDVPPLSQKDSFVFDPYPKINDPSTETPPMMTQDTASVLAGMAGFPEEAEVLPTNNER